MLPYLTNLSVYCPLNIQINGREGVAWGKRGPKQGITYSAEIHQCICIWKSSYWLTFNIQVSPIYLFRAHTIYHLYENTSFKVKVKSSFFY